MFVFGIGLFVGVAITIFVTSLLQINKPDLPPGPEITPDDWRRFNAVNPERAAGLSLYPSVYMMEMAKLSKDQWLYIDANFEELLEIYGGGEDD